MTVTTCRNWHPGFGACELPFGHEGLHSRVPGGAKEANEWHSQPMISCRNWHTGFGACELPFGHEGLHSRVPGGAKEANLWDSQPVQKEQEADLVNHPRHYNDEPHGIECIRIVRWMNFNLGNAVKYIWRAGKKGDPTTKHLEDLEKALWYLNDEIKRVKGEYGEIS